jgi:hypothetical protein
MKRREDWPEKLAEFVESRSATPFAWGSHDCCQFAAQAVAVMTGEDLAAKIKPYTTAAAAARVLKKFGGVEAIPGAVGLAEIPIKRAQRGDVVSIIAEGDGRNALGLCCGTAAVFPGKIGIAFVETSICHRAWRVG